MYARGSLGCSIRSSSHARDRRSRPPAAAPPCPRGGEVPRRRVDAQVGREALVAVDALDRVRPTPRRCRSRRTAPRAGRRSAQRGEQAREQPLVIEDPVEGGVGEDRVDRLGQLELEQVRDDQLDPVAEPLPRELGDHRRRGVDADHPPAGNPLEERRVTRPLPQPASSTVSSPSARAGRAPPAPSPPAVRRPGRRSPRPSRGVTRSPRRSQRRGHRAAIGAARCLEGVDRPRRPKGHADVVEAVEQAVLDLLVDLEPTTPPAKSTV